jgi:citrate synthase
MVQDEETKIARPRQIYTGARERDYVPIGEREKLVDTPVAETNPINPAKG